jgi:hypothetical protein
MMTKRNLIADLVMSFLMPTLLTLFLLYPVIFRAGIPFYGDVTYYISPTSNYAYKGGLAYIFGEGRGPAIPFWFFPNQILLVLISFIGNEWGIKCYIILLSILPFISSYFSAELLLTESTIKKRKITSFTVGLFNLLIFTNIGLTNCDPNVWIYVGFIPMVISLIKYIDTGRRIYMVVSAFSSLFASIQPFWVYLVIIAVILYVPLSITKLGINKLTCRLMMITSVLFMVNTFWLLPSVAGYFYNASGVFSTYITEKIITFENLKFLSHWNLLDVLMVGEHKYYFFWLHPQNYGPLNAIIPILAATSILVFRRNKYVLFMALILVTGIFLTKGVWEPGGYLYYLIANNLPYGAGAILRNPTKFVPLVTFSYSFMIGILIANFYEKMEPLGKYAKLRGANAIKYGVITGLILLMLMPITYGTILYLHSYTWPRFKPTYVPNIYDELNSWLSKQPGDFKVMWIPSGGAYVWKPYIITAFPDLYSSRPAVSFRQVYPQLLESTDEVGKLLKMLGVRYVIYHGDSLDYPNEEILQDLLRQKDLKVVYESNYTYVPEDNSGSPLPMNQPDFQFSQSPFKLIMPEALPRGNEAEVIIQYTIPQSVVDEGFKGKFWAGFGIGLNGFSAGSTSLDKRIFWAGVYEQKMINNTCGYAVFKVKVPYTYPGTAVDVYANFYDGSFRPLTPSYFVARLLVSPREVNIPFIVFENEEYSGPVYVQSSVSEGANDTLQVLKTGVACLLNYKQISPVEWEVTVNASNSFVLVFTEPYDRLWRAYVNGKEVEPMMLCGMVNGFPINETGILHIRIYYILQMYYNVGLFTSGISFIILIFLCIHHGPLYKYSTLKPAYNSVTRNVKVKQHS